MRVRDLDQFAHRGGTRANSALQEAEEQQPTRASVTAVEPEGELVQVGLQGLGGDPGLVGAGQPALEPGDPLSTEIW